MLLEPKTETQFPSFGLRRGAARPCSESLIVHVLFIDLVGYSKLTMEKQYEASCDLAECVQGTNTFHRALQNGIVTCMDTGDGMALAFKGDPLLPARLSLEIAHARGFEPERPIRMGLHSGPVMCVQDINDKPNYKGVGMNIAQRVMDCAIGGQIALTEHYASILRSYDGWSEKIVYRGIQTVKHGLKLRVCELLHPFAPRQPMKAVLSRELPAMPTFVRLAGLGVVMGALFLNAWLIIAWPAASRSSEQAEPASKSNLSLTDPRPKTSPADAIRISNEDAQAANLPLSVPATSDTDTGYLNHSYTRPALNDLYRRYGFTLVDSPDTAQQEELTPAQRAILLSRFF